MAHGENDRPLGRLAGEVSDAQCFGPTRGVRGCNEDGAAVATKMMSEVVG